MRVDNKADRSGVRAFGAANSWRMNTKQHARHNGKSSPSDGGGVWYCASGGGEGRSATLQRGAVRAFGWRLRSAVAVRTYTGVAKRKQQPPPPPWEEDDLLLLLPLAAAAAAAEQRALHRHPNDNRLCVWVRTTFPSSPLHNGLPIDYAPSPHSSGHRRPSRIIAPFVNIRRTRAQSLLLLLLLLLLNLCHDDNIVMIMEKNPFRHTRATSTTPTSNQLSTCEALGFRCRRSYLLFDQSTICCSTYT